MKPCNIIVREDGNDPFDLPITEDSRNIVFPLGDRSPFVQSKVFELLSQKQIAFSGMIADLLNLAVTVYTVDQIVSRAENGYQGWSRYLRVYFPVIDIGSWNAVTSDLEKLLSFLSGDRWEFTFRRRITQEPARAVAIPFRNISKVCLLSGGLDSLIGGIDLLEAKETVAFVSHHKRGLEGSAQDTVYRAFGDQYPASSFEEFNFYVQPDQQNPLSSKEDTSRARSFLFLTLGLGIANSLGPAIELIVPENGLISLNVPLTDTRLSSHSTRTTHPFYISTFQRVLQGLGIQNPITNPYRFKTKGEMMLECSNRPFMSTIYPNTLSCSHPDHSRYTPGSRPGIQCGYCVPCIIRQAAEKANGQIRTQYTTQVNYRPPDAVTRKGRDYKAFKMALDELQDLPNHSVVMRILKSGPLPITNQQELDEYVRVYKRGMAEVRTFLQ